MKLTRTNVRRGAIALTAATLLAAAGCGGGSSDEPISQGEATVVQEAPPVSDGSPVDDTYFPDVRAALVTYREGFVELEAAANSEPDFVAVNKTFFRGRAALLSTLDSALKNLSPSAGVGDAHSAMVDAADELAATAAELADRMERVETEDELDLLGYDETYNAVYAAFVTACTPVQSADSSGDVELCSL